MKFPLEGRWLGLAALIAVVFAGGLVLAVRFVSLPELAPAAKTPAQHGGIGIAAAGDAASGASAEDRALLDPNPLFLPTEYNASEVRLPAIVRREPGASLQAASAKFEYTEAGAPVRFPEVVAAPGGAVEALSFGRASNPYEVFGRVRQPAKPLPERQAFIEVVQTVSGRIVFSAPLVVADAPEQLRTADWRPLELLAAIDATGLIGLPVISSGSGVDAIDAYFKTYLARQFRLGERLPPGFYALRVGP